MYRRGGEVAGINRGKDLEKKDNVRVETTMVGATEPMKTSIGWRNGYCVRLSTGQCRYSVFKGHTHGSRYMAVVWDHTGPHQEYRDTSNDSKPKQNASIRNTNAFRAGENVKKPFSNCLERRPFQFFKGRPVAVIYRFCTHLNRSRPMASVWTRPVRFFRRGDHTPLLYCFYVISKTNGQKSPKRGSIVGQRPRQKPAYWYEIKRRRFYVVWKKYSFNP